MDFVFTLNGVINQVNFCAGASSLRFPLEAHGSNINLKQGAHIHQPTARPVPRACAQPYHPGSGSHGQLFRAYWGSSAWHSHPVNERGKSPCIKDPLLQRRVIFSVHWLGGYAMLMSPNKGETAVHCCHCPGDMAVRVREVLARPWVGVCVPRFNIIIECWFKTVFSKTKLSTSRPQNFFFFFFFF